MRSVTVRLDDLRTTVLNLGFVGENEHTQIRIDSKKMFDQYPTASPSLTVCPPDGESYPAVIERDGDFVLWTITDSDLIHEGSGEIQLSFTVSETVAKSYIGRCKVSRSIVPTGEIPEGIDDFLTRAGAALTAIPETIDEALAEAKASGEFDGPPGEPGQDGYSPTATVSKSGKTATITITDKNGTTTAQISDGEGGGTSDYSDLTNKPQIGGVTLSGDKSLHDLGIAASSDIPDPTSIIDDTAGDGATDKVWSADKSADTVQSVLSEIQQDTTAIGKITQPKLSRNIFNGEMWATNGYFQDSGNFVADNGYRTTAPVYLEAGNYMFNVRKASVGSSALKVFVVNSTGETVSSVISGTDSGLMFNEETNIVTFTLATACYTRYNMASSRYASSFMIVKGNDASTYPTTYIPYVEGDLELKSTLGLTEQMASDVASLKLKGKKLSVNGDSICYGEGYTGGYAKIIGDTYGMTVQNVAVSGGTITAETYSGSSARHWISRTITSMSSDADFAIIEGGVNDAALTASISLGTLTNDFSSTLDDTTYIGALESTLKQLTTRFAGKKYGFIIVHKASTNFSNMGSDNSNWYWATRHALEKWGVPYLDLNVACPPFGLCSQQYSPELYALAQTYTKNGDGWHPNEEGYKKYYVPKIVDWMCSL